MKASSSSKPPLEALKLPIWLRVLSLLVSIGLVATLLVARSLSPAATGLGTHQQLGLPPCTSIFLWNAPCPACGMTTSWAWMTRGHLLMATKTNIGGTMLAIIALVYIPAGCYFCFIGRASKKERFSLWLAASLILAILLSTVQWFFRMQ
jgi:hypothetical protein